MRVSLVNLNWVAAACELQLRAFVLGSGRSPSARLGDKLRRPGVSERLASFQFLEAAPPLELEPPAALLPGLERLKVHARLPTSNL